MKYGIKYKESGSVTSITKFEDTVAPEFTEITKAKYEEFLLIIRNNSVFTYDETRNMIIVDAAEQQNLDNQIEKKNIKERLRSLSVEIDLLERMSEDTTVKESEFQVLLNQYNS